MLSFDIRSLREQAVSVDADLEATDPVWQEGDPRPADSVHVSGRLAAAGPDRFYWHAHIAGTAVAECRRCLTETRQPVEEELHLVFAEAEGEGADDPDVYLIDADVRELDLRPAIREEWLLAAPAYPLCTPDCKGFCPRCGANLNDGPCSCPPATDSRWDALRKAGSKSGDESR